MKYFIKTFLPVLLLAGGLHALECPPPEAFTVFETAPAPGPRITPYLRYQVETAWRQDELRKVRLAAITDESDFYSFQRELRNSLLENMGGLPGRKTPLNPRITGKIQMEGYRIEKLIFESLPGYHVSANLYVPDGRTSPGPAILVSLGHSPIAKTHPVYQSICARLAKRGYVVITWDPVGQGERSQFWDEKNGRSRYNRVCGEHAVAGNLAYLAGASLVRWMVWDGIRAHDYLLTRPEV
ncbi:MAG: hypothetical protein U9N45_07375, partial [Gemmatimonadota bacterium]|nr:hypothetical protein [Gemmatimonadota bacterium]